MCFSGFTMIYICSRLLWREGRKATKLKSAGMLWVYHGLPWFTIENSKTQPLTPWPSNIYQQVGTNRIATNKDSARPCRFGFLGILEYWCCFQWSATRICILSACGVVIHTLQVRSIENSTLYSDGHLPVITGYKWDYTFYKWGYKYL